MDTAEKRPIGIGMQGVADMFFKLGMAFEDEQSLQMEAEIMETIYHGALEESVHLANIHGPYERFEGSPFLRGERIASSQKCSSLPLPR
jgi:ribonucleotide reductase alpha subunit